MSAPAPVGDCLDEFAQMLALAAFADASRDYWLRQAREYAAKGTPEADEIATACRNRAALTPSEMDLVEWSEVLEERAARGEWSA